MSVTFLLLRGLPGSGKTTFADTLVAQGWRRINKDTMRTMLLGPGAYDRPTEDALNRVVYDLARDLLFRGFNVVSDNMNLDQGHYRRAEEVVDAVAGEVTDAILAFKDFDTPLETCIERDAMRPAPVGEKVIRDLHKRYLINGFSKP